MNMEISISVLVINKQVSASVEIILKVIGVNYVRKDIMEIQDMAECVIMAARHGVC